MLIFKVIFKLYSDNGVFNIFFCEVETYYLVELVL